jgi:hypothetical protein
MPERDPGQRRSCRAATELVTLGPEKEERDAHRYPNRLATCHPQDTGPAALDLTAGQEGSVKRPVIESRADHASVAR